MTISDAPTVSPDPASASQAPQLGRGEAASMKLSKAGTGTVPTWNPAPAPQDGKPFWAYLYESGIRKLQWISPEATAVELGGDAEDYVGVYADVKDHHDQWEPAFWLPEEAISEPDRSERIVTSACTVRVSL